MKFTEQEWLSLSRLLDEALTLPAPERKAWLAALTSASDGVRPALRELLAHHGAAETDDFLRTLPRLDPAGPVEAKATRLCEGVVVGPYRLLRQVGIGGMGEVWLAERTDAQLKRPVALKLPRVGFHSQHVVERFDRERDILAALVHPHIARLYDAGVAADGQPFLALEYVDGQPLGAYCDEHRLDLSQRLTLFLQVLSAVQYAHARLVVHRDLKPSNVLVTPDGQVRLLDFGIAKLLTEGAAAETELTQVAGRLLTPDYASPEQISGAPITVASDVYSLGVILYELVTGERPYRLKRASRGALEEAILESDAERPSTACRDPAKAALRGMPLAKLEKTLRGDLDTIVLKALKKNVAERYPSVTTLTDDIRRYLNNEPISARADTVAYRATKFVRRHTGGVAATGAVVLVLAGLIGFYTAQLAAERDRARLEAQKATSVSSLLTGLLTGADPDYDSRESKEPTVRGLLDAGAERIEKDLARQPELQAEMLTVMGRIYRQLGLHDKAQSLLEKGLATGRRAFGPEHERVAQSLNELGALLDEKGDYAAAAPVLEQALAMRRKLLGPEHKDVAVTLVELGRVYMDQGDDQRAEPLFRESLAIRKKVLGEEDHETATSLSDLAVLLWHKGDLEGAESLYRQCLAINRKTRGETHPDVATTLGNLAGIAADKQDYVAAEALFRQSLALARQTFGEKHPDLAAKLNKLSSALRQEGKYDEAASASLEALQIAVPALGNDHPLVATYRVNLARVYLARQEAAAAEPLLRQALEIRQRAYPEGDWRIGEAQGLLGESLTALRRYDEAEGLLLNADRILKDGPGWEGREAKATRLRLVALYQARGQPEKAATYRAAQPRT
jgi:serine/threonine protein kinase/Tfp pilus assembly protein PilF